MDPREGVYAAVTRLAQGGGSAGAWRPGERLGLETVVRAYTEGPARAAGLAHRRGTLAPGQDADFVAWEVDPALARDPSVFRLAQARLTVVGGEVVMRG